MKFSFWWSMYPKAETAEAAAAEPWHAFLKRLGAPKVRGPNARRLRESDQGLFLMEAFETVEARDVDEAALKALAKASLFGSPWQIPWRMNDHRDEILNLYQYARSSQPLGESIVSLGLQVSKKPVRARVRRNFVVTFEIRMVLTRTSSFKTKLWPALRGDFPADSKVVDFAGRDGGEGTKLYTVRTKLSTSTDAEAVATCLRLCGGLETSPEFDAQGRLVRLSGRPPAGGEDSLRVTAFELVPEPDS